MNCSEHSPATISSWVYKIDNYLICFTKECRKFVGVYVYILDIYAWIYFVVNLFSITALSFTEFGWFAFHSCGNKLELLSNFLVHICWRKISILYISHTLPWIVIALFAVDICSVVDFMWNRKTKDLVYLIVKILWMRIRFVKFHSKSDKNSINISVKWNVLTLNFKKEKTSCWAFLWIR